MIGADDLREFLGLGAIGFVAARADDGGVRKLRLHGCGVIGVPALGAMAGLASHVRVTAKLLLVDDVGVATLADVVAAEGGSTSRDFGDRVAAVMAILAKALGDHRGAEQDENCQQDHDDDGETDEMFSVLEHNRFPGPKRGKRSGAKRPVILDTGDG